MALDTVAIVEAGIEDVYDSIQLAKTTGHAEKGRAAIMELQGAFRSAYIPEVILTVTDLADATITAFFAGEGVNIDLDKVFEVNGVGDTTDNALAAAKGGAVAAGDKFQRTAAATVKYLGADFTFAGEAASDW